jgi:beta-glucosidase-like glycosyl hydrolase
MQLHLTFADNVIGAASDNGLYDHEMRFAPSASLGVLHDFYPTNKSQYNSLQTLNLEKSRLKIPFMQFGECLHGVGSMKQSMFPQSIGLSASWDTELVHKVGRAIGKEARSIGIHACLSPVLDLGLEPRWGRVQEAWGEDMLLTSHMGVAMASGLSNNGSWSEDAVVPVMKHFAAHGSPQGGINGAPSMVLGTRQVLMNMLRPFKAVIDLAGVRGVMMAYSELDSIPSHIQPMLYEMLDEWGFDGFVTADDAGVVMLQERHRTSASAADTIAQWFNSGGQISYYDYPLETFMNATIELVNNGTVSLSTLQSHVRNILNVKYDLGLFENPYILPDVDSEALTTEHTPLTLEAAQKSIVLLENRNGTLPLRPVEQKIRKIALIGPMGDTLNYGDYSGQFGAYPVARSSTLRQAMVAYLSENASTVEFVSSWGSNTWEYNAQYNIPAYLLSVNGTSGGLLGTYFADTNFTEALFQQQEAPNRDWGLYPPNGLPSNNFSVIWEGELTVPVDDIVNGYIGVAVYANTTATLYIDGELVQKSDSTTSGNVLSNIPGYSYIINNATAAPPGSSPFTFVPGVSHKVRLEYQAWNYNQKFENTNSVNAEIELFWNLVDRDDPTQKAVDIAADSDVIVLAVGANWNSDGEGGDRATLDLSTNQTELADAIFELGKPVILVLQGGRPFAIPEYYSQSAAVLNTFFPGQSGGQAISDVIFGVTNPGGRVPITVPYSVGTLPVFYK